MALGMEVATTTLSQPVWGRMRVKKSQLAAAMLLFYHLEPTMSTMQVWLENSFMNKSLIDIHLSQAFGVHSWFSAEGVADAPATPAEVAKGRKWLS